MTEKETLNRFIFDLEKHDNLIKIARFLALGSFYFTEDIQQSFIALLQSQEIAQTITTMLAELQQDEDGSALNELLVVSSVTRKELTLITEKQGNLSVRLFENEDLEDQVYTLPGDVLMGVMYGRGVAVSYYQIEDTQIKLKDVKYLSQGEYIHLNGHKETFSIDRLQEEPICILTLSLVDKSSEVTVFDKQSGNAISWMPLNESTSRWLFVAKALEQLPCDDSIQLLRELTNHSVYLVRWEALKSLSSLNETFALQTLQYFAGSDPHPLIRKTAQNTLAQMGFTSSNESHNET